MLPLPAKTGRYIALDSLRGLAALTVVFSHFSLLQPLFHLRHSALRLFLGGHEAVILFFVLSGFVLTLQVRSTSYTYLSYVVRRICRIYIPYISAVFIALYTSFLVQPRLVPWAGSWFNGFWGPTTHSVLLAHIAFIFPFSSDHLVPVIWSLVYEMRISLIFPFIVIAMIKFGWKTVLLCSALLSLLVCTIVTHQHENILQASIAVTWLPTLHYLLMFVCGAAMALHRESLAQAISSPARAMLLLLGGVFLYFTARPITLIHHVNVNNFLFDWTVLVATCMIIAALSVKQFVPAFMERQPFVFLGKISYSLYLFHTIVLLAIVHAFPHAPFKFALAAVALLIVPISYLAYQWIEAPAMQFGVWLTTAPAPRLIELQKKAVLN